MNQKEKNLQDAFNYGIAVAEIDEPNCFMRFGKNSRIEAKNLSLPIGKIQFNFQTFNEAHKQTGRIPLYMDVEKALVLSNDILTGKLATLAKYKQEKGDQMPKVFISPGGSSAAKAKREDGKCEYREFAISKGKKWIVSASVGPGKETATGGFVADGKADLTIKVGLDDDSIKAFAILTKQEVLAYRTAQMLKSIISPFMNDLNTAIEALNESASKKRSEDRQDDSDDLDNIMNSF